jgi:hypothetical protein
MPMVERTMEDNEGKQAEDCETAEASRANRQKQPTIEAVHRDVEFGIQFRLELSKTLLTLAAALFAFTVAFPPAIVPGTDLTLLWLGWGGLCVSMAGGFVNLYGWEKYYLSYRDYDWDEKHQQGKEKRKEITLWRRIGRFFQFGGFLIGTFAIGLFTIHNLPG